MVGLAAVASLALFGAGKAQAYTIYGDSASFGNNPIHIIDSTTGVESQRFVGQPSGNGRGVVTVGNTIYYTVTNDPNIYKMDKTTGVTFGSILTQNASMSTLAWDGSHFWTSDYAGTNEAFEIDPVTGNNIKTINLALAGGNSDGMEFFNGKLIANRGDGGSTYDIYDLNGNVLTPSFITTPHATTGIAFDGTNFLVSDIDNSSISYYDGTTGAFLSTLPLTSTQGGFLIEDLSVDYATRSDTGGGTSVVPEPGSLALLVTGGLPLLGLLRRRRA